MKQIATNTYEKLLYKYISLKVIKKKIIGLSTGFKQVFETCGFRFGNRNIHRLDSTIKSRNTDRHGENPVAYFRFHFVAHPWRNEEKQASRSKPPFEICTPATGYLSKIDRANEGTNTRLGRDVGKPRKLKDQSGKEWFSCYRVAFEIETSLSAKR